ncbi:MAG: hypothetical protein JWL81_2553 [Verrucomicrobiales bacterium]|nr:hypothetical protein [Verrucomicrobiales bacterium]
MAVAVLSTVGAFGIYTTTTMREAGENTKLERDVAVLNKALRQYELFGGSLSGVSDPQLVLNKLKTRLIGDNKKEMAGLKGSMLDSRLRVELQTDTQAASTDPRARYIAAKRQFAIETSGNVGIKRFVLDEALAKIDYGTEHRDTPMRLAKVDKWVWDFQDTTPTRDAPTATSTTTAVSQPLPPSLSTAALVPPAFNLPSGTYPLKDFPVGVTLTDPNVPGTSELLFSVGGGPFQRYTGTVQFDPGTVVTAYATPMDPDKFDPSGNSLRDYRTAAETPVLTLTYPETVLSYSELGGPMLPSNTPGKPVQGLLSLANGAVIPDAYQSSTVFQPRWTLDGSDPLSSTTASISPDFSGGYPGSNVPVALSAWKSADNTLTVKAAVKTLRPEIVTSSAMKTVVLTREVTPLPPPVIAFTERDCTLSLDTSKNNVPQGARIFYTLDGTDPGQNGGEPVKGILYDGPFLLVGNYQQIVTITARTYPPAEYKEWFSTSPKNVKDYKLPAAVDVYVGGDFEQGTGGANALRGIARLRADGQVDTRFNTGSGASAGSLVGVVRQTGSGVVAGGDFESVNSADRPGLVMLQYNGAVDPSFNAALTGGKSATLLP